MFKKIVTELTYSPALAGSLGDYIKQLRSERSKRQIGLIFVLLALVVQLLAALSPPESANATNPAVFIDGGVQSIDSYLEYYDQNAKNIKDLLTTLGIARADLKTASPASLPTAEPVSLWSMSSSRDNNSRAYSFVASSGKSAVAYHQPISPLAVTSEVYIGSAATSGQWFAIEKSSGNLVTPEVSEATQASSCTPWFSTSTKPHATTFWGDTASCPEALEASLSARTILSGSTAIPAMVRASDRIEYTLTVKNTSESNLPTLPAISLEDVLEYSRILDNGSGTYNYDTRMLHWPSTTLSPGEELKRNFIIQLLPTIPSTPRGQYVTSSYDCTLYIAFGTALSTLVNCPPVKSIESLTNSLISTSKKTNLLFAAGLLTITLYLYLRSRQRLTELYIIRHNHLGGL